MMDFNMFQEVVKDNILHSLPAEYKEASVSVHAVPKVNRTLHALTVMLPDRNKAPNIYLEEMYEHYQQNKDIQTTLAEVADAVVEATKEMSKVNPVLDADKIQDNVVLCLVNSTQNEELLKDVPNRRFQDLSVIYRWVVNIDRNGMQSMIITNDFAANRGFTEEAEQCYGVNEIEYTLENLSCCYVTDLEDYLQCIIKSGRSEDIEYILQEITKEKFSEYNQLGVCVWAVKNDRLDLCKDWIQDIVNKEFTFISDEWIKRKFNELDREKERFKIIASIMYVLSYVSTKKFDKIRKNALEKSGFKKDNQDKIVAEHLLTAIGYIAYMEQCILMNCSKQLDLEVFKVRLDMLLEERYYNGCFGIETILFRKGILESIIQLNDMLPQSFTEVLKDKLCEKAKTYSEVMLLESYAYMDEFISKTKKMTLNEMFDYIEVQFDKGDFYWDYIKYFIQRAQSQNSQCITDYKLRIMKMLEKREINNLEYDGCNRLYTVLFPYLNDGEVINVLKQVIDTYYHQKSKGWTSTEYGLMNDLDNFTFALFSRFSMEDNIWGLHEILKMHCLWLNGTENLEVKEIYHLEEVSMVENWCEFFNQLERCVSFSTLFGA